MDSDRGSILWSSPSRRFSRIASTQRNLPSASSLSCLKTARGLVFSRFLGSILQKPTKPLNFLVKPDGIRLNQLLAKTTNLPQHGRVSYRLLCFPVRPPNLFASSRKRKAFYAPTGEQGFSLIFVFLIILTVITTTLSITNNLLGGRSSVSLQTKLRLARDAAQNGLYITSSELNKVGNRQLLGQIPWTTWKTWYDGTTNHQIVTYNTNANCQGHGNNNGTWDVTQEAAYTPSGSLTGGASQHNEAGTDSSFKVIGFNLYDKTHTPTQKASKTDISYLVIVMQGYYNSGTVISGSWTIDETNPTYIAQSDKISRYVLQQEYEVIPRCCGRSFGPPWGNDSQYPDPNNNGQCPNGGYVEWMVREPMKTAGNLAAS